MTLIPFSARSAMAAALAVCAAQIVTPAASAPTLPISADRRIAADSVGPVKLGMTRAQAESALGAKFTIDDSQQPGGSCKYARRADKKDAGVSYMLLDGRIERIDLFETSAFRTANNIGIGDPIKTLQAAYPGKLVHAEEDDQEKYKLVGKTGGIVFGVDRDAVSWINVGRYPALNFPEGCL